jgi:SAM-dependent methyltransferase
MERPWLAPGAASVWGGDVRPTYELLRAVGEVPDGGTVVDAPCGAGLGFRSLSPHQRLRYLAVDISSAMVERARRKARDLGQVEVIVGDAEQVPVADASVDLFVSMWGLHCLADPPARIARGGPLPPPRRATGRRDDLHGRRPPAACARSPLDGSVRSNRIERRPRPLAERGRLGTRRLEVSGAFAYFDTRRPSV